MLSYTGLYFGVISIGTQCRIMSNTATLYMPNPSNSEHKFIDDLKTILRQFSDLRQSYTTVEFTEHIRQS